MSYCASGLMLDLLLETVAHILAALPFTDIMNKIMRVCRSWHSIRTSAPFLAARTAVDERGLVVAGGSDGGKLSRLCYVLLNGRWCERASMPFAWATHSVLCRGELVLLGFKV